jgi:hypothetical protein
VSFASGCGKIGSTDDPDATAFPDLASAQTSAKLTQVTCFSDQDCNPSVAMLAAVWTTPRFQVSVCTGFMVAPDILATNSHCLPVDLDQGGVSCSDRLYVFFPTANGYTEERAECDTVISSTGHNEKFPPKQDLAFVKLKAPTSRPALQLSRDGFADKAQVRLVKVNPSKGEGGNYDVGSMQTVDCYAEQHSTRLPTFDDNHSPLVALGTCEVVGGNSGSPVLDSQGRVVGIVQAYFDPGNFDPNSLLGGPAARLNVATSMACIQSPVDSSGPISSACNVVPGNDDNAHAKAWNDLVSRRMEQDAETMFASSLGSTGTVWKGRSLDANSTLIPAAGPRSQYDDYVAPVPGCVTGQARIGTTSLTIPLVYFRTGFDEFLVPTYQHRLMNGLEAQAQLTLTPSGSGTYAELMATDSQGTQVPIFQGMVPTCSQ